MNDLQYNDDDVTAFERFLRETRDDGVYEHGEFEIADGITVSCDWSMEADEPFLIVSIIVSREGFDLFTRGTGDTLTETGSYGHGPNHGDEIAADVEGWIASNLTDRFDEIVFEYSDQLTPGAWLFSGHVPNPNA